MKNQLALVALILFYLVLDVNGQTVSKLMLNTSMVTAISPVGEGNPSYLVDEQTIAGDPATAGQGGAPTTSWGTNLAPKIMTARIDLGANYVIKQVWLFDTNGAATLPDGYKVIANTSAGDITLVNSALTGWMSWEVTNVNVTTRTLTITNPTGYLGMNELVLYGYASGGTNNAPIANAGIDKTITLPTNSTTLSGSGTDTDGTISSYAWTQQSGPSTATLSGSSTTTLTASSLIAGSYTFRLTVTDNQGAVGTDDAIVLVNPAAGGTSPWTTSGTTINYNSGAVGIGTATTGTFKLAVEGKIGAREVNVTTSAWADYVFEADYALPSLESLKVFIDKNKHLPEIPTAQEVETNGVNLGEMNTLLLKKIEELTLYAIEQNKLIVKQNERISKLENKK
jgi:hypothetical protein